MKTLIFLFFFLFISITVNSQIAEYPSDVLQRMDQNKINNFPTLTGIEFVYKVSVYNELLEVSYNDNTVLSNALSEVMANLNYTGVQFSRNNDSELYIEFTDDTENKIDDLKIALNEKNIKSKGFSVFARIKN